MAGRSSLPARDGFVGQPSAGRARRERRGRSTVTSRTHRRMADAVGSGRPAGGRPPRWQARRSAPPGSDPGEAWRVNVLGTVNVLEAVRTAGARGARARRLDGRGVRPGRADSDDRGRPGRTDLAVRGVEGGGRGRPRRRRSAPGSTSSSRAPSSTKGRAVTSGSPSARGRRRSCAPRRPAAAPSRSGDLTARRDITDVRDVVRAYGATPRPVRARRHVQRRLGPGRRDARGARHPRRPRRVPDRRRARPGAPAPHRAPRHLRRCLDACRAATGWEPTHSPRADPGGHAAGRPGCLRKGWPAHERQASTDHGHHRPGRLVPGRAPAGQGLRGLRHGPPLLDRELRAHLAPRRPGHARPGRSPRPASRWSARSRRPSPPRSTTSRRRASCRPPGGSRC